MIVLTNFCRPHSKKVNCLFNKFAEWKSQQKQNILTKSKKKAKECDNIFGHFSYQDVPSEAYPLGIVIKEENGYIYQIAAPEKALCDKLYIMPPVTSQRDIEKMLFDDLRIDTTEFDRLNFDDILQIGDKYHCNNLKYLMKYLRRNK